MSIPFLSTLSKSARQAYPAVQRGVREGLSANEIQGVLKKSGIGIRRQTLLNIVRAERGVQAQSSQVRNLRRNFRPNPSRLPEALTPLRRNFSFKVEIRGFDPFTGAADRRFVTVTTDELLTRQEIEDTAAGFLEEEPERYQLQDFQALLVGGLRAGPLGTL